MDAARINLLEVLFDGQGGFEDRHTLPAGDSKVSFLLQDHAYGYTSNTSQGIRPDPQLLGPANGDPEAPLRLLVDPNDIYEPRSPATSPESDDGVSDAPCPDPLLPSEPPPPDGSPPIIYEVICDMGMAAEAGWPDPLFVHPLDQWMPSTTLPSSCIPSEASLSFPEDTAGRNTSQVLKEQLPLLGLCLTDEEQHLLSQEGILLHNVHHLTKAEERILKKIRRKIRNKQSAQDSRRRKKEYLDGLESRAAACSAQNQALKKKVQQLEKHKMSLLDQLRNLQGLLKETSSKAAQTSTCLVILLFSLGLFLLPSLTSFFGGSQAGREEYKPSGVISRTILTQSGTPELEKPSAARLPEWPRGQSPLPEGQATSSDKNEAEMGLPVTGGSATENTSEAQRDPMREPKGRPPAKTTSSETDWDPTWPMHADEI